MTTVTNAASRPLPIMYIPVHLHDDSRFISGYNLFQVIVVLPTNRKDRYDSIKKMCCLDNPVPSQCILGRTLSKKQTMMSVTTKVAMQLNCKLGGELWALEVPVG